MLDLARSIFTQQAFTRYLGAELVELPGNGAVIELPLRDELRQQHGYAHGGALSYLADNTLTFAGGMALKGDTLTSEFKINYLRPARRHCCGPRPARYPFPDARRSADAISLPLMAKGKHSARLLREPW
ncbi:PaaI family thioesterase [Paracoccus methylarcula]|uniref:PaaI family thioesterase n=1 Tax=Paracoccus methylarcula TaxID=72022 RepID=UPI001B876051|nr:PaaI family thioesterase [Paracoccus methylarcula]